jgi:ABC-2 type transport system permease protein
MGKLFAVIRREYLERVRNKWFVIVTIFGPVFFAVIMIVPAYLSVRGMRDAKVADVRVVDATGAGLGARVARRIVEPSSRAAAAAAAPAAPGAPVTPAAPAAPPRVVRVDTVASGDLAAAESSLVLEVQADRLTGYLILDSATIASGSARYAGRNASSVGESEVLEGAVRGALMGLRLETAGVNASAADSLTRLRVRVATERITDSGKSGSGVAGAIFGFVIAFMLYMAIILYGQAIMRGVLEEKTTRVAEVILASVKPDVLLAGKVIGVGAVGLTQFAVWIASGIFFWGERTRLIGAIAGPAAATASAAPGSFAFPTIEPFTIVALLLFFLLGYTFYASLFAAVGAMVSTQEEANQAVQPVMMMLVFSIIFVQPVMTNPTGRLAEVMSVIPFSAPIIMPMRMTATPVPALTVMASLAGVALAALAAIWLSARIYRVGLLMYGKRPTVRELWRWVRQS